MQRLVILKNPVRALGSQTINLILFIKPSPGGPEVIPEPGDTIVETESAPDVEEIVSKYAFGGVWSELDKRL